MKVFYLIAFILIFCDFPEAITVKSGKIFKDNNEIVDIGPGTFIPSPSDIKLAEEIVKKNSEIERLMLDIDSLNKIIELQKDRENKIDSMWSEKYKEISDKLEKEKSIWKVVIPVIAACVVSTVTTYITVKFVK